MGFNLDLRLRPTAVQRLFGSSTPTPLGDYDALSVYSRPEARMQPNAWNHVVLSYRRGRSTTYLNGISVDFIEGLRVENDGYGCTSVYFQKHDLLGTRLASFTTSFYAKSTRDGVFVHNVTMQAPKVYYDYQTKIAERARQFGKTFLEVTPGLGKAL